MCCSTFVFLTLSATGSPIPEMTNSQASVQKPEDLVAQTALLNQCDPKPELELEALFLFLSTAI